MKRKKIKVGVIFGGRSSEHEVSIVSAESVMNALDKNKFEVIPIGITKQGKWITGPSAVKLLKDKTKHYLPNLENIIVPDATKKSLVPMGDRTGTKKENKLDIIIPILHGPYGEDGTVQGLFELANIPYIGAGVLGSALGMDKILQKQIFQQNRLPVVDWAYFIKNDYLLLKSKGKKKLDLWLDKIIKRLSLPLFIKPANSGSSVGINKAHNKNEFLNFIEEAFKYDRKIIIEKSIENAREIEIAALGNDHPRISVPGEIIPANEFYDYNAKYIDGASQIIIPAKLSKKVINKIQAIAIKAFKALDCFGMARIDFLLDKKNNFIYLSEINTIPGFTSISMYPKLWEYSGISYTKLLEILINLAMERFKEKNKLKISYQPKKQWYR